MITADEAFKTAYLKNPWYAEKELLNEIDSKIQEAVKQGQFFCDYEGYFGFIPYRKNYAESIKIVCEDMIKILTDLGYTITNIEYDGSIVVKFRISWDKRNFV